MEGGRGVGKRRTDTEGYVYARGARAYRAWGGPRGIARGTKDVQPEGGEKQGGGAPKSLIHLAARLKKRSSSPNMTLPRIYIVTLAH